MVFQMLPGAGSVMPIKSRQEGATSGWIYIRSSRLLDFASSPITSGLDSARLIRRCGMSAPAGTEFM